MPSGRTLRSKRVGWNLLEDASSETAELRIALAGVDVSAALQRCRRPRSPLVVPCSCALASPSAVGALASSRKRCDKSSDVVCFSRYSNPSRIALWPLVVKNTPPPRRVAVDRGPSPYSPVQIAGGGADYLRRLRLNRASTGPPAIRHRTARISSPWLARW